MKSLSWKIVVVTMIVVLIPVFYFNQRETRFFDEFSRSELEFKMRESTFLVRGIYMAALAAGEDPVAAVQESLKDYQRYGEMRFRLLSPEGELLFDSNSDDRNFDEPIPKRIEFAEALESKGWSARARRTDDREFIYYYLAQPVKAPPEQHIVAVIYTSCQTSRIIGAVKQLRVAHRYGTLFALMLAMGVAVLLAWTMTGRLRNLIAVVTRYAKGDSDTRAKVRKNHDEIDQLGQAFNSMADEIELRHSYNRDFVATTMHELKAPVTAIMGAAELLEKGAAEKPESRKKFIGNIRFESKRMNQLIGELNELACLDIEALHTPLVRVDLVAEVRQMLERLDVSFGEEHAPVKTRFPEHPVPVMLRVERFEQVLANLLDNAYRYTPKDGEIWVAVSVQGAKVQFIVRDNGNGIAPVNQGRVFDRFFTTEPKGHSREYGSGLGLAVAKSIVEMHHGEIFVNSEPRQGAAFTIELPLAEA
jgi:signal transduction histidine kinase